MDRDSSGLRFTEGGDGVIDHAFRFVVETCILETLQYSITPDLLQSNRLVVRGNFKP